MPNRAFAILKSTRLPFLVLTPICILLGVTAAVKFETGLKLDLAVMALLCGLCAHISANTFNEFFDFTSGLDKITERTPFSGGSGALPATPKALYGVLIVAVGSLLVTVLGGIYLAWVSNKLLFILGLVGLLLIVLYTRVINRLPKLCLIAPGLAFGPIFVVGTVIGVSNPALINGSIMCKSLLLSLVPFFMVNNLLLLNQFPDLDADKEIGRKTLPIVYGLPTALRIYALFSALTAVTIVVTVLLEVTPLASLAALLPMLLTIRIYSGVKQAQYQVPAITPFLGLNVMATLLVILIYSLSVLLPY